MDIEIKDDPDSDPDPDYPDPDPYPSPYEQQDYEVLPIIKLFSELQDIVTEIKNLTYLENGWCLLLLRQFKWDKEYLKEEYYNKMEEYQKRVGFSPNLENPKNFQRGVLGTCEVCCA